MSKLGAAFVEITAPMDEFVRDIRVGKLEFIGFVDDLIGASEVLINKIRDIGVAITGAVTLPIAGASAAGLKLAADAEEAANLYEVAFERMGDQVDEWAERLSSATGLSKFAFKEQAASMQLFLRSIGFVNESATRMSTLLTQLSTDVGSLRNQDPERVFELFKSGLAGSTRAIQGLVVTSPMRSCSRSPWPRGSTNRPTR